MIRYSVKKWWSLKESPDGQYVAYHEAQGHIDELKIKNEQLRKDIQLLWDNSAKKIEEIIELKENCEFLDARIDYWYDKYESANLINLKYSIKNKQLALTTILLMGLLILHIML